MSEASRTPKQHFELAETARIAVEDGRTSDALVALDALLATQSTQTTVAVANMEGYEMTDQMSRAEWDREVSKPQSVEKALATIRIVLDNPIGTANVGMLADAKQALYDLEKQLEARDLALVIANGQLSDMRRSDEQ